MFLPVLLLVTVRAAAFDTAVSFYVDAFAAQTGEKGTKKTPFKSLGTAMSNINRLSHAGKLIGKQVHIYILSDLYIEEAVLLTIPVKITGINYPALTFGDNAGFVVSGTTAELEFVRIARKEFHAEPRSVPLIYGTKGQIVLVKVEIDAIQGGTAVILRNTSFTCRQAVIHSFQNYYATLVEGSNSKIVTEDCTLNAEGLVSTIFLLKQSSCVMNKTRCTVLPQLEGCIVEMIHSVLQAQNVHFTCNGGGNFYSSGAVFADKTSDVTFSVEPVLHGFSAVLTNKKAL